MNLTDETLADARALKPAALEALLAAGYAPARRVAHALSGDEAVGRSVAQLLVRRSLRMLPRWRDPSTPENWFYHHAVLTTRGVKAPPPDPHQDPLVVHGAPDDPAYVAFVRAVRNLPPQQREAFILHHGERLNPRLLGVTMDCSMDAAKVHLSAATEALDAVTEHRTTTLAPTLARAYKSFQAALPEPAPWLRVQVRRVRRRVWARRIARATLMLLVLSGIGWAVWRFRDELLRLLGMG